MAAMNLSSYPRPHEDTGIGIHWCAGHSGLDPHLLREFWLPELRDLGVSWVIFAEPHHALPVAADLLAAGMMPVIRVWNGSQGDPAYEGQIGALVHMGVRYFGLEIGLPQGQRMENHVARVAQGMESLRRHGALPGLPPPAPDQGDLWVALLQNAGYRDLLAGQIWQAVRNFGGNRPLSYPDDLGNREGIALTQDYYHALAAEEWPGRAWGGRRLHTVNQLRREAVAGNRADLPPDDLCWLSYMETDRQIQEILGRSLPLLSTAGGWVVGASEDPRYPAVTPLVHMAHTLEACRAMMGNSQRYPPAPAAYFCTGFWLLANAALDSDSRVPETQAWYSEIWPHKTLPIVAALKDAPKRLRHPDWHTSTHATPAEIPVAQQGSVIAGLVRGGAGAHLRLVCSDGTLFRTVAKTDGRYRFVDLAAGRYTLWVETPPGSRRERIDLDGDTGIEIGLTVDGWGHEVYPLNESGSTLLRCRVESSAVTEAGTLAIRLRRVDDPGGQGRVVSLARRADGAGTCEIFPLASGAYRAEVLGLTTANGEPLTVEAIVQLNGSTGVTFVNSRPFDRGFLHLSSIYGKVHRSEGSTLVLTDEGGKRRIVDTDDEGIFAFENLPPGQYTVAVVGHEQSLARNRLGLDGRNGIRVEFTLPQAGGLGD